MDRDEIKQQVLLFIKARNNLLAVIAFSVINIILAAFNVNTSFLFSATIPQFVFSLGKSLDNEIGSSLFMIIGLILAFSIIASYFIFWALAKRIRVFVLVALIFFSIDSLVLLMFILKLEYNFSYLLEIAFHGWILFYMINGVKAWSKIRFIDKDIIDYIMLEIKNNKKNTHESDMPVNSDNDVSESINSYS